MRRSITLWLVVACVFASASLNACSNGTQPTQVLAPVSTPTPSPTPAQLGGGASPGRSPISGLIDMQSIQFHDTEGQEPTFDIQNVNMFPGVFGGIVINATWDAIQPSASPAPLNFSQIDTALTAIQGYNSTNPSAPLSVKLRIYAGSNAPLWARQIDGGPLTIYRNPAGCDGNETGCPLSVGKYWTADYIAAWRAFQAQVAARYDSNPLISQVAVTSCAPQTDEPFVPSGGTASKANLIAAGYTDVAEQSCLSGAFADYSAWKSALIDYTFNQFGSITGASSVNGVANGQFTVNVMTACRTQLGSRCVLNNHALSYPPNTGDLVVYQAMTMLGGPINFQTQSPEAMGCIWNSTVAQGIAYGARAIELWPDAKFNGFDSLSAANLQQLKAQFASPIPIPSASPLPTPCTGFH